MLQIFYFLCYLVYTARKTIFSFSKCSEKMVFPKKLHWNMIFLVSSGKIFLFPKNMILFFRRKIENDLSQKIHGNMIYFSNVLKRWSLQKDRTGIWSFFYHQERWHFFFPKVWYFFYGRKMKDDLFGIKFSKNTWKYDVFCKFCKDGIYYSYKYAITRLSKK